MQIFELTLNPNREDDNPWGWVFWHNRPVTRRPTQSQRRSSVRRWNSLFFSFTRLMILEKFRGWWSSLTSSVSVPCAIFRFRINLKWNFSFIRYSFEKLICGFWWKFKWVWEESVERGWFCEWIMDLRESLELFPWCCVILKLLVEVGWSLRWTFFFFLCLLFFCWWNWSEKLCVFFF
jgi:hypothetical protein